MMKMTTTRIVTAVLVIMGALQLSLTFSHRSSNHHYFQSINFARHIGCTHRSTSSLHLSAASVIGSVTLVGSGPGDPDLLTLQAYKLLKNASLVVSDRLVSSEILALIDCEVKVANKKPGCADDAQAELNEWVINAALQGRNVVRLKIGDPFLFGRGGEEVLEYRKHGIEAIIAPGLSSSYAAPLSANIPITHRGIANQVVICTGYGQNGVTVDVPEYRADRTVVLLMAVGRLEYIANEMLSTGGYPEEMPVSIIENATTPKQRVIVGTLRTITDIAVREQAKAPAIIVVGFVNNVLI